MEKCEDYKRPYACDWEGCDKRFKDNYSLVRHRTCIHEKAEKFQCTFPDCNKVFYRKDHFSKHIKTPHKDKDLDINNDGEDNRSDELDESNKNHEEGKKKKRKYRSREYKCDWVGCDAVLHTSRSEKAHKAKHQGKVTCQVEGCNYVAGSDRYLRQHLISHSNDRPFQCEHCGKCFKSESAMTVHMRKVHSEQCPDIPYIMCDNEGCDFKTKLGWQLKNHRQRHSRSIICETCVK